jgi:alkylhydroperoxidase family enzyme
MNRIPILNDNVMSELAKSVMKTMPVKINLFRTLAHADTVLESVFNLTKSILTQLSISPQIRELVIIHVAKTTGCEYEKAQHIPMAISSGVKTEDIDSVISGDLSKLSLKNKTAIEIADWALNDSKNVSDDKFKEVMTMLSYKEVTEIYITAGAYRMLAAYLNLALPPIDNVGDELSGHISKG